MSDSTKVRLVRCPKCENLLPELAHYSVYQCGGCGAVLRAKDKNRETDRLSHKSDEAQLAGSATELQNSLEKGVTEPSDTSDVDIKSNAGSLSCDERNAAKDDEGGADCCGKQSNAAGGESVVENDNNMNTSGDSLGNSLGVSEQHDLSSETKRKNRSCRSGQMMSDWESAENGGTEGFQRVTRNEVEGVRFSTSNYPDEGPSNYNSVASNGYGGPLREHDDFIRASRVQHLEKDRADLLRKLDELKEQLSKSCDVADKSKEKVPLNSRIAPSDPYIGSSSETWFSGGSSRPDRASAQFFATDKHAARPSYMHHHSDPFSYSNGHEMAMHNIHPSMHESNHIPGFGEPFALNRASRELSGQYPSRQYFSRNYFDPGSNLIEPYTSGANFHQASCSCFHCYERHHGVSTPVPPTAYSNKRFPDVLNKPMLYQHENPGAFAPHIHNSRATAVHPPLDFRGGQSHARWPSDLNYEMGNFVRYRPRGAILTGGGHCCRPMAGGAPFFSCFNCFEVLQVPRNVLLMGMNQQKIRCGACSTVINFAVVSKKLVLSVNTKVARLPAEVDDSSTEMIRDRPAYSHGRINATFSSDDYDDSSYDFQTVDPHPVASLTTQGLNSIKHQEMNGFHTSSLSTSGDENSPDALIAPREVTNSAQRQNKASLSPPPAGSPLQQHFDYSSNNYAVNRFGKGNRSSRSDQEKVMTNRAATRQNSMKDASLATEIEVPFHEYSNTGVSQDSGDANREDSQLKSNKGGESFLANIIKKSFKDFSRSNQTDERVRSNVCVNGHLIPDRVVKKAEKFAGPIHPGQYWYDFRAGFWGVIGGPCLGIIPPFIEEFNYSMPEDCAGGNTSVYVNGRELHQKDLDLLSSRGLPTDRDRSYIIEISGRVLDEDTGKELDSLGKLAPTVEKVKHGFGMKVPKVLHK